MTHLVSIVAASALISAALVGGMAVANGSPAARSERPAIAWTDPPAAAQASKVRVIPIDGRVWSAGDSAAPRAAAPQVVSR